jgi:hypothetical protein
VTALRDALASTAEALARGDAQAASDSIVRAVACCDALRTAGVRLEDGQLVELIRLVRVGVRAVAALRRETERAQQALSASRRAVAAYHPSTT